MTQRFHIVEGTSRALKTGFSYTGTNLSFHFSSSGLEITGQNEPQSGQKAFLKVIGADHSYLEGSISKSNLR